MAALTSLQSGSGSRNIIRRSPRFAVKARISSTPLASAFTAPRWHTLSACAGADQQIFYGRDGSTLPMTRRQISAAREICHGCPVQRDCLAEAIEDDEREFGIWGGYTAPERDRAIALHDPPPRGVEPTDWVPSGRRAVSGVLISFDTGTLAAKVIRL